ncbi:hypothetical protein GYMLUDRAFT_400988 [Collybiopsis luxurians FD-317 M1]|nr:hypothetical protein GYMLUDRAFT_400988 [Collybiopsis luxurians FD-317 M1]
MYMTSTLDGCFLFAPFRTILYSVCRTQNHLKIRSEELDKEQERNSNQQVRYEVERLNFTMKAPKNMRTFLSHGEACTQLEPHALSIHLIKGPSITVSNMDLILREYDSVLNRLDRLGNCRISISHTEVNGFVHCPPSLRMNVPRIRTRREYNHWNVRHWKTKPRRRRLPPPPPPLPPPSKSKLKPPPTPILMPKPKHPLPPPPNPEAKQNPAPKSSPSSASAYLSSEPRARNIGMAQHLVEDTKQNSRVTVASESMGMGVMGR